MSGITPLDGQTFFFVNKKYNHARIACFGDEDGKCGTYEGGYFEDQLWVLKEEPKNPGYYYIFNVKYPNRRIAKWGDGDGDVGTYGGHYYSDQLWKFENSSDGYFLIHNFKYKKSRITKWGKGDNAWGTYDGDFFSEQYWSLEPRFKSTIIEKQVWAADNTAGSEPFSETVEYTHGVEVMNSETFQKREGFTVAMETSIGLAKGPVSASASVRTELSQEMTITTSSEKTESWTEKKKITFTAPAGKKYKVTQFVSIATSSYDADNCNFLGSYTIHES